MATYGTPENYLRVYGGPVESQSAEMDKNGLTKISLNREVRYPRDLLLDFDTSYQEDIPELVPTEEEEKQIHADYDA